MKLVQLCCGGMNIPGWDNRDRDCDITRPLPDANAEIDGIFIEHGVEHITQHQAWHFFKECLRVLKPGGVLRIAVPSIVKIQQYPNEAHCVYYHRVGFCPEATIASVTEALLFNFGHQSAWTEDLLAAFLCGAGFHSVTCVTVEESAAGLHMKGIHQHGKVIGESINTHETIVVEAFKYAIQE